MFKIKVYTVRKRRTSGMGKNKNLCKKLAAIYLKDGLIGKKVCVIDLETIKSIRKEYKTAVGNIKKIQKLICKYASKDV